MQVTAYETCTQVRTPCEHIHTDLTQVPDTTAAAEEQVEGFIQDDWSVTLMSNTLLSDHEAIIKESKHTIMLSAKYIPPELPALEAQNDYKDLVTYLWPAFFVVLVAFMIHTYCGSSASV